MKLPPAFDGDLRLLTYSMFSRRVVMGFLQVVRAIYFALLGFTPVEIGVLLSIATFVSALHSIAFGFLADRYGRKPFLLIGGVFATMRMVIFAVSTDFWILALGQGLGALGEGAGAGQPVVSGYITDKTGPVERPQIYSTLAITNAIAATIGSAVAGLPTYVQEGFGLGVVEAHSLLWWICAAGSAFSMLFIIPLQEVKAPRKARESGKGFFKVKSWGVILRFSLVRSTSGLGWGLTESLLPLYFFIKFSVGPETLGPIYAFARFLSIFSYLLIPPVVDRFGEINTIIGSRLMTPGVTSAFAFASWYPLAVILLVLNRIVVMFTMPIRQTFASGMVDPEETATAIGISSFARMGVRSIAPTLAGYMFESLSLSLPFITGAVFMALNGVLYKVYFKPEE